MPRILDRPIHHDPIVLTRAQVAERNARRALVAFVQATVKVPCWRRWPIARALWHLQFAASLRAFGHAGASQEATRSTILFCLPRKLALLVAAQWR